MLLCFAKRLDYDTVESGLLPRTPSLSRPGPPPSRPPSRASAWTITQLKAITPLASRSWCRQSWCRYICSPAGVVRYLPAGIVRYPPLPLLFSSVCGTLVQDLGAHSPCPPEAGRDTLDSDSSVSTMQVDGAAAQPAKVCTIQPSTLNVQPSALNRQPSSFNLQPSNSLPSTLNPGHCHILTFVLQLTRPEIQS